SAPSPAGTQQESDTALVLRGRDCSPAARARRPASEPRRAAGQDLGCVGLRHQPICRQLRGQAAQKDRGERLEATPHRHHLRYGLQARAISPNLINGARPSNGWVFYTASTSAHYGETGVGATATISSRFSSILKSSGFAVHSGRSFARATAAISKSTT